MVRSKKARENQQYENYWKLTLEYSDFKSDNFNGCLKTIIDFIDTNNCTINGLNSEQYNELQEIIYTFRPKSDMGSVRKSINQFLKLGFINNKFKGYHRKAKEFLHERDESRKKRIYSEILYDNASFSRSFLNDSNINEINFLIKTLEYCGSISRDELLALMFTDVSDYTQGYLTLDELNELTKYHIIDNNAMERKYNQVSYLFRICRNILAGIYFNQQGNLTLDEPDESDYQIENKNRDPYKQRLYKIDLYNESYSLNSRVECYYEQCQHPILIASHIKPYSHCNDNEQFDVQNGLLLSKNIDALFDKGWISFNDDGSVICALNLDPNLQYIYSDKKLDTKYLTNERKEYLQYHRDNIFKQDKQYTY